MSKIGLAYSFNTVKTKTIARYIIEEFGTENIEELNAENLTAEKFLSFDRLILGVPTWFDGELPNYWDEFVPEIEDMDLKGKKIAVFGNGNQIEYSENFVDGIGIMAILLEIQGATLCGFTSTSGYNFEKSRGVRDTHFLGLALDFENQSKSNKSRVKNWVNQLKNEF